MQHEIEAHLRHIALRGLAPNTIRTRRAVLRCLSRFLAGAPVIGASEDMLTEWRASLQHLEAATVASYLSHMRQFYEWAAEYDLIALSPGRRIPSPKKPKCLPRPIGDDDLTRAVCAAHGRVRIWLVLMAWCGLRACEISGLRSRNIVLGGDPHIWVAADATKGSMERRVPLSPFAVAEISAACLPAGGWAFRRLDGKPGHPSACTVSHVVGEHYRSLGITATGHQGRHWFGCQLQDATDNVLLVSEVMGHVSVDSTKGYAKVSRRKAAAAVALLPVPAALRAA
jgi:integrase